MRYFLGICLGNYGELAELHTGHKQCRCELYGSRLREWYGFGKGKERKGRDGKGREGKGRGLSVDCVSSGNLVLLYTSCFILPVT
jgi:hypothetical protein